MNQRKAKTIRQSATEFSGKYKTNSRRTYKLMKEMWNSTPRHLRNKLYA